MATGAEGVAARNWSFLEGGGQMGALVRTKDWSQTPLGAIEHWPQSLRTSVSTCLNSRFAILIWWGPELVMIYNDAYMPTLGRKHPASLGMAGRPCWPEIWHIIGPMLEGVLQRGEATWSDDLLLILERHGYAEECYFTFSYSPIHDESGGIGGVFTPVYETTERYLGRRRLETLERLGNISIQGKRVEQVCGLAAQALGGNKADLPFAAIYLVEKAGEVASLVACDGIAAGTSVTPEKLFLNGRGSSPLDMAAASKDLKRIVNLDASLPGGAWNVAPPSILVLPIVPPGQSVPGGFLMTGENPRKRLDRDYRSFLDLVGQQLGHAMAEAEAFEQERRRAEALAELDRAKTAFFANVSHEFRTPLTLMLAPLKELLDRPDDQTSFEERRTLELVHRNGLRLQKLVNALLEFSRLEAGRAVARYEPVDLEPVTAELASSFRSAMTRAGLEFVVECELLSRPVYINREMWERIVLNLLSNALKYTFEGRVTVRLRERPEAVELEVEDTGVGIPETDVAHIFERFHRGETTRARTFEGTGIGLALVQELARLHGGSVSARSRLNEGSTFTVTIPFGTDHLPAERVQSGSAASPPVHVQEVLEEALTWLPRTALKEAEPRAATALGRVLLADDNADMRDYISRLLGSEYQVRTASNGPEALRAAVEEKPDLVLCDIMMPEMDGFQLLKELRGRPDTHEMPVIFLSARAGEEASVMGREAGADDYIVKPFTARELLARVRATLTLQRERRIAAAQLSQILAQAPAAICVMRGPEYVFEFANSQFADMVQNRHIVGRMLSDVVPNLEPEIRAALDDVLNLGKPFVRKEWHWRAEHLPVEERERWLDVVCSPLRDPGGNISGIIGIVHDTTEQCRARRELERVNRELEEFAFVASHDLREPLRMVNSYSQLLVRNMGIASPEELQRYVEFIASGVRRMEDLIRDLLLFARTVQKEEDEGEPVELGDALRRALESLTVQVEETRATVDSGPLPVVLGEPVQVMQLFQNLISNALKYARPGVAPEIRINAIKNGRDWTVAVEDNGIGFRQEYAGHIFGLFKRLHREEYPGTGLGLAICKRIVERYNGRIWAESTPGVGSRFFFSLPAGA